MNPLTITQQDPKYTYFAIGSMFRDLNINLSPELDQVYPTFLKSIPSFRAFHYDPEFSKDLNFIDEYFFQKGFVKEGQKYISFDKQREFYIIAEDFYHDINFFKELSLIIINSKQKLVVQEFTGRLLNDVCLQVHYSIPVEKRKAFRENILFDMTGGNACCMTNMKETFPILDKQGNFLNFTLIPPHELLPLIHYDPKLDILIEDLFKKEYKRLLNEHHTNYRRRINGDTCLFPKPEYDQLSEPKIIFKVLIEKLQNVSEIRKKFRFDFDKFNELIQTYQNYDMYKWYGLMNAL